MTLPIFSQKNLLTIPDYFYIFGNMETIIDLLPLAPIQAQQRHTEAFKALSHLTRLRIFFHLVRQGVGGDSVGSIQKAVKIPWPTLSHHLDILQRAGLLTSRREERFIFYTVKREVVSDLVRLLTACC